MMATMRMTRFGWVSCPVYTVYGFCCIMPFLHFAIAACFRDRTGLSGLPHSVCDVRSQVSDEMHLVCYTDWTTSAFEIGIGIVII